MLGGGVVFSLGSSPGTEIGSTDARLIFTVLVYVQMY